MPIWAQNGTGFDLDEKVQKVAMLAWDTETLSWVRATVSGGGSSGETSTSAKNARFELVGDAVLYIGKAAPGALDTDPVWQVVRIHFNESGFPDSILYANGGTFSAAWSNRTGLAF